MSHHKIALATITAAALLDTAGGLAFASAEHLSAGIGLYWAVTTATTCGYGDVTPHTVTGHLIAVMVMLTVVPLFAATFSLFTSALAGSQSGTQVAAAEERLKADADERHKSIHNRLDAIQQAQHPPKRRRAPEPGNEAR